MQLDFFTVITFEMRPICEILFLLSKGEIFKKMKLSSLLKPSNAFCPNHTTAHQEGKVVSLGIFVFTCRIFSDPLYTVSDDAFLAARMLEMGDGTSYSLLEAVSALF